VRSIPSDPPEQGSLQGAPRYVAAAARSGSRAACLTAPYPGTSSAPRHADVLLPNDHRTTTTSPGRLGEPERGPRDSSRDRPVQGAQVARDSGFSQHRRGSALLGGSNSRVVVEVDGLGGAGADALIAIGVAALCLRVISARVGDAVVVLRLTPLIAVVVARHAGGEHQEQQAGSRSQRALHGSLLEQSMCQLPPRCAPWGPRPFGLRARSEGVSSGTQVLLKHVARVHPRCALLAAQRPRHRGRYWGCAPSCPVAQFCAVPEDSFSVVRRRPGPSLPDGDGSS